MTEVLDRETLKALSTDTRQEIIKLLSKRPYTASEISKTMNKHVTTITEHLNTLEKAGLIKRKQSNNKWVYYALSDKGERLFKPRFYSWVIALSVSAIFLFAGVFQVFTTSYFASGADRVMTQMAEKAEGVLVGETLPATTITADNTGLIIGIILIAIAIIGISWFAWSYRKSRKQELKVRVRNISL